MGGDKRFADGGLGEEVGGGYRIEQRATLVVNRKACPEMRQYDRTGPVGKGVGRGQEIIEGGVGGHCVP